jgi:3alpha(or 20beta)-hydroxysteroid dehydrogenase
MRRVADKVAIITGGARGQGAEHARLLAAEGAKVLITDILDNEGKTLATELNDKGLIAEYAHLDVTDADEWTTVVAYAEKQFGRVDILVNNAGIVSYSSATDCTDAEWDRIIAINQTGVFYGLRATVPALIRAGGGSIINVSSVYGGMRGAAGYIGYVASKAAVCAMTQSVAMTYGAQGIRANAIAPGMVDTAMTREETAHLGIEPNDWIANAPINRQAHASETSPAVLYLASDESSYVTGTLMPVDGGISIGVGIG